MLGALKAVGQETHRLDFKRARVGKPKLAQTACAFANADGGIIAVGFDDPDTADGVKLIDRIDISDEARTALVAAINARVYPPLPLELCGYSSGYHAFLVLRIDRSRTAPHEYIFADSDRNLPVRSGTITRSLRLAEIDALRERTDGNPQQSPLGEKPYPMIPLMMNNPNADNGFTLHVAPASYAPSRRIFDKDDDRALCGIVLESRGYTGDLYGKLRGHPYIDGVHFYAGERPNWMEDNETKFAPEQITVDSDGDIALRFLQNDSDPLFQYVAALGAGYLLTQKVFLYLRLTTLVSLSLLFHLDERRLNFRPSLANYYRDYFDFDLAQHSFADSFLETTLKLYRAGGISITRSRVSELLTDFASRHIGDLRSQWR